MNIICIVFGTFFIISGTLVFFGKKSFLSNIVLDSIIKEDNDEKRKMGQRNIGSVILLAGIGFLLSGTIEYFIEHIFLWYMIAWFLMTVVDVFIITKREKSKKEDKDINKKKERLIFNDNQKQ